MSFDIYKLDNYDPDEENAEQLQEEYLDAVMEQFFDSPEGKLRFEEDSNMGFWAAQMIHYGFGYIGITLPQMNVSYIEEIVTGIFPRKITIESPEEANDVIPELISFWLFLKREYKLPKADSILKYLSKIKSRYYDIMNDSSKYGMAKSFMMAGKSAGFDMTDGEDIKKFQTLYNASLGSGIEDNKSEYPPLSIAKQTTSQKKKKKNKRKTSKASRKKNKKRK